MNGSWSKAEPLQIFDNCVNVTYVFSRGVSVIESEVAVTLVLGRHSEIQTYCLCVTNMKEAIWFWRETSLDTTLKAVRGSICQQEITDVVTP